MLGRQPSAFHEGFETGGEDDGEGFWGRQCDPDSGMAYYLNEKVGVGYRSHLQAVHDVGHFLVDMEMWKWRVR